MASSTISSSDPIEQQASDALASYLDHDHDPQQAISRFTEPIASICKSSDVNESELEQPFQALWNVIIARARATTSDPLLQDRLVTFLSKLKSTSPTSSAGTPHIWGASLWGDLPLFGSSMREKWNAGPGANWPPHLSRRFRCTNDWNRSRNQRMDQPQRLCRTSHSLAHRRFRSLRYLDHAECARDTRLSGGPCQSCLRLDPACGGVSIYIG